MSNEQYNKGYFSFDTSSPDARESNMARMREREEHMKACYSSGNKQSWATPSYSQPFFGNNSRGNQQVASPVMPSMGSYQPGVASQNQPATFVGTVESMENRWVESMGSGCNTATLK